MATGGEVTYVINSDDKDFNRAIGSADSKMGAFDKKSRDVGGFVKGLFTYDMIKGAITGMADLVSGTIGYTGALEQSQIAWNTLLGSQEAAQEMQKNLQDLAKKTPFDYAGVDQMAKSLSMAGFEGQDLMDAVVSVGDAVSAVGGNTETATGATRALYQMYSKGKVQAEEMMQLSEAGIPVWQILAKETGKSVAELQEMGSAGELLAEDVLPMLVKGMGTEFGGAMAEQSQSFNGLMATFQDQLGQVGSWLTMPLFDSLKKGLSGITGWVDGILSIIQKEGASRPEIWDALKVYFKETLDGMIESFKAKIPLFKNYAMKIVMNMISGISDGAPGIRTKAAELLNELVISIRKNVPQLIESGGEIVTNLIKGLSESIPKFYEAAGELANTVFSLILNALPGLLDSGASIVGALSDGMSEAIPKITETVIKVFQGFMQTIMENLPNIIESGKGLLQALIDGIVQNIPIILDAVLQIITELSTAVVDNLPTILEMGKSMLFSLLDGITQSLPSVGDSALGIIDKLLTTITDELPSVVDEGVGILTSLVSGISERLPEIAQIAMDIVNDFISKLSDHTPEIVEAGVEILWSLIKGLFSVLWNIDSVATEIANILVDGISKIDLFEIGVNIVKGLWNGISSVASWIGTKISGFVSDITAEVKDFFGIASPSKLMADEVGQWLPKGIAVGIEDNASSVFAAMDGMNRKVQMSAEGVVTPYSKDIAATQSSTAAAGNTFTFYQTNNSPDPIDAREAARLARINAQRLGYELQGG